MLKVKLTENYTGVIISGDYDDLDYLYDSIHYFIKEEEESIGDYCLKNHIYAFLYDLRHAYQGDREYELVDNSLNKDKIDPDEILAELQEKALAIYEAKREEIGEEPFKELQRIVLLKVVDTKWMDHIDSMDELKNGIGLRAYGQKDPVIQYQIDGSDMFEEMINSIKLEVAKILMCVKKREGYERRSTVKVTGEGREDIDGMINPELAQEEKKKVKAPIVNEGPKVGRNDLCPCGSGKKYKNCCGK